MKKIVLIVMATFLVAYSNEARKVTKNDVGILNSQITQSKQTDYDFWLKRANISLEDSESDTFFNHISLYTHHDSLSFFIGGRNGKLYSLGKKNLDSIKTFDLSLLKSDNGIGLYQIFKVPFNELDSIKGQCFMLQTSDEDPRLGYMQFQVKLKVLDFKINDLANNDVDMKFVWMANFGGLDMTTEEPIDTFDITGVVNEFINHKPSGGTSYQVLDNRVILNSRLVNDVNASVYNVSGQLLFRTPLKANATEFVLPQRITTRPLFIDIKEK